MAKDFLFTSESVTEGHPDKICDRISDAFLDEYLLADPDSRVAVETMVTTDFIAVAGEVTSKTKLGLKEQEDLVRKIVREIGYDNADLKFDANTCKIELRLHSQSPDISQGVTASLSKEQGAGDQGLMFGYATDETEEMMPLPIIMAHKLTKKLTEIRKLGKVDWIRPDGKSQVTVQYKGGQPESITAIVISTQHAPNVTSQEIERTITEQVIKPVCGKWWHDGIRIYVNPTGKFEIGGPHGDAGLTGRKIIVDTYGGYGRHGGGAFSGKDPSKVDRSACYMCRYVAKNIVAAGLANRCEVQVAYAIGVAEPVSLMINTFGTAKIKEEKIENLVKEYFDMRPLAIITHLDLKRPIYKVTSAYGHFGRIEKEFTWEKTDMADRLQEAAGI
ncbi:MAG: S-adenosylmethionine synthetase [Cenarchaeum symbiont of Oopsacas minuta]|nr:S-adenosylmethionine synthetase [Cenarchaeum symbiont of Oopsacas minuta]